MCEFISWIEYKDQILFLKDSDLKTKEGKELVKYLSSQFSVDIKGHGAIRKFYNIPDNTGTDKECTNFKKATNFPVEIVKSLLDGDMIRICGNNLPLDILTPSAKTEYQKITQSAWAEYQKITQPAWAEYLKIQQSAWAEYLKIQQSAWAEYLKIQQSEFWKLMENKNNIRKEWKN